jgi:glycosyltransferase involved in cell wall biosynthesis
MRNLFKKTYLLMPLFIKKGLLHVVETYHRHKILNIDRSKGEIILGIEIPPKQKKRVLIYHLTALYYAGTEKGLQIIAEALSKDYEVIVLHATDESKPNRKSEVEKYAKILHFTYDSVSSNYPYYINGMSPHINAIIEKYEIDLLITAGTGKAEYPFISITKIPIILINIFGAPCVQSNIKNIIFISDEVKKHSEKYIGKQDTSLVAGIPISTNQTPETVPSLRKQLSLPENAFIFGRIGRGSDAIFDPIGINAFEILVRENNLVHYVIVSPPPILKKIVSDRNIPNVHFLPATADEKEIWTFYYGIDALAHFRFDGETLGLNITESMYAKKPIISHVSHIWNAHLEYLENSFSRVTPQGDVQSYLSHMREFVILHSEDKKKWDDMCEAAKKQADLKFSKTNYQHNVLRLVTTIL